MKWKGSPLPPRSSRSISVSMGWFSSSSSSDSVSISGAAPDRSQRSQCWESRDAYFACLDKNGVQVPGQEGEACKKENNEYKGKCAGSWVSRQFSHRFEGCGDAKLGIEGVAGRSGDVGCAAILLQNSQSSGRPRSIPEVRCR